MGTVILVYSLSGNTRRVAEAIATRLSATISVLQAPKVKPSVLAVVRLGFATLFGGTTPVLVQGPEPTRADLLILAGPVWAGRLNVPMRSWLAAHPVLPARVALVMTGGQPTVSTPAFADFAARAGVTPVATLYVSEAEATADTFGAACNRFCGQLTGSA